MDDVTIPVEVQLGPTQIRSKNVRVRPDALLDEVTLECDSAAFASPATPGETGKFTVEKLSLRIVLSEPNLNAMVSAAPSSDVRNLKIAILTEKMKITGQFVKLMVPIPFTLEAAPRLVNGVRIELDFLNMNSSVIRYPAALTEFLEKQLRPIDLSQLPFPVYLDRVRCEPGRLVIEGKARIHWPPAAASAAPPFSMQAVSAPDPTPVLAATPEQKALPAPSSPASDADSATESADSDSPPSSESPAQDK